MKLKFCKQVSKLLIFSIFVTGLPLEMQAAWPAEPVTTFSASTSTCTSYTAPASCQLAACPSPASTNTPTGACTATTGIAADANYGKAGSVVAPYLNLIQNIYGSDNNGNPSGALAQYQNAMNAYGITTNAFISLSNIALDGLMVNPGAAVSGTLPFTVSTDPSAAQAAGMPLNMAASYYPNGDFVPVFATANPTAQAQLFLGFMEYMYNTQFGATGQPSQQYQQYMLSVFTALLFYTLLDSANLQANVNVANYGAEFGYWIWQVLANIYPGNGQPLPQTITNATTGSSSTYSVRTAAQISAYLTSTLSSSAYYGATPSIFNGGALPAAQIALLMALATGDFATVKSDLSTLSTMMSGANWTNFLSDFAPSSNLNSPTWSAWVIYTKQVYDAINSGNLYFRCDVDPSTGTGLDSSLYYAGTKPTVSTIKYSTQYLSDNCTQAGASATCAQDIANTFGNTLAATVFSYLTGQFYYWLPGSYSVCGATDPVTGACTSYTGTNISGPTTWAGLDGGNGSLGAGSLWASVCANSSSATFAATQATVLQQMAKVATQDSIISGNTYTGDTLQGASANLLAAVKALAAEQPFASFASSYTWANSSYPTAQMTGTDAKGNTVNISYTGNNVTVKPIVLTGFPTSDQLNMISDMINIASAYEACWANISLCSQYNAIGTSGGTPPGAGANSAENGYSKFMQKFPIEGMVINLVGGAAVFMGFPKIYSGLVNKFQGRKWGTSAADVAAADAKAASQAQIDKLTDLIQKLTNKSAVVETSVETAAAKASGDGLPGDGGLPGGDVPGQGGPGSGPKTGPSGPPVNQQAFDKLMAQTKTMQATKNAQLKEAGNMEDIMTERASIDNAYNEAKLAGDELAMEEAKARASQFNDDLGGETIGGEDVPEIPPFE